MAKFLIGLVTGIVLTALVLFVIAISFIHLGEQKPSVASDSLLVLRLDGDVPEQAPPEIPIPFFESQTPFTVRDVWMMLRNAATDSRIKAVVIEPRNLAIGWGRLEEIKSEMERFRKSGKPLVAFLRGPGTHEYYLACAADRVYLTPEDMVDVKGLRLEAPYLKGTLDKLGVKMDVIHAGKYKDAGDVFTRTSMSPETREVLNQVLDQYYGDLAGTIATGRKKTPEQVKAMIDQGPFSAQTALSDGLVDKLAYSDEVSEDLKRRLGNRSLATISARAYLRTLDPYGAGSHNRIALIVGEGAITRGSGQNAFAQTQGIASGAFIKLLKQVENDSSIKGAILRINSPGGDGVASDDILHEAKNLSRKKPVVISMSDLAASGGYFIAMTGDPIVAYPNTLTGSIGVIWAKPNLRGLYDKIGIQEDILTRGRYAGIDSNYAPMTVDENNKVRGEIDRFYASFVSRVSDGRRKKYADIEPLAQGRVWLGEQAKQNGLVDSLGGLDEAIALVKQRAHIAATESVALVPYPPKRSILDLLLNRDESPSLQTAAAQKFAGQWLKGMPLDAWVRGGFLELMPYMVDVQ